MRFTRRPRSASACVGARPDSFRSGRHCSSAWRRIFPGLAFIAFQNNPLIAVLALPFAALASGLLAYVFGVVVFRRPGESGAYFSMITLALSLLAFQIATSWNSVTGGFDGLKGIPGLPGLDDLSDVYYVSAAILLVVLAFAGWLYTAPIGVLWRALAQNERRLQLFGFDTNQLKSIAFGVSGLMAGIGGAIYAPQQGIVTPQLVGFGLSADLVIWAAVGGRGSLLGPVIGTLLVGSLSSQLRDTLQFWEVLMALFFIAIVLVFPRGIAGLAETAAAAVRRSRRLAGHLLPRRAIRRRSRRPNWLSTASAFVSAEVTILDQLSRRLRSGRNILRDRAERRRQNVDVQRRQRRACGASGRIGLGNSTVAGLAPNRVSGLGVARKLQIPSVFPDLSIADNLAIALWSGRATRLQLLDPRLRRWTSPMLEELHRAIRFSPRVRARRQNCRTASNKFLNWRWRS